MLKTQKSIILSYIIGKGEVNINPINCKVKGLTFLLKIPKDCNKIMTDQNKETTKVSLLYQNTYQAFLLYTH